MPLALLFSGAEKSEAESRPGRQQDTVKKAKLSELPGLRLVGKARPAVNETTAAQSRTIRLAGQWKTGKILTGIWRNGHERSNSELATRHLVRPAARSIEPQVAGVVGRTRLGRKSGVAQAISRLGTPIPASQADAGRRTYVAEYLKRKGILEQIDRRPESLETPGAVASRRKGLVESILNSVTPEEARRSLSYLDRLFSYFALVSDVPGQQKTLLLALAARNRARKSGMSSEADLFDSWLEANS